MAMPDRHRIHTKPGLRDSTNGCLTLPTQLCGSLSDSPRHITKSNPMRLIAITLTALLTASTFAHIAYAQDGVTRSAELEVLERFIGTWDTVYTEKPAEGEPATKKSIETRKWSLGGRFVHWDNLLDQKENPNLPEMHSLVTYDPYTNRYVYVRFIPHDHHWHVE